MKALFKNKYAVIGLLVTAGVILAITVLVAGAIQRASSDESSGAFLPIRELYTRVPVPSGIPDLSYKTRTVQAVGTIAEISTQDLREENPECSIGALYLIEKSALDAPKTRWTAASLRDASVWQGNTPPQVKEFPNSYLVFEPSQAVCSSDAEYEAFVREEFWNVIAGAELI